MTLGSALQTSEHARREVGFARARTRIERARMRACNAHSSSRPVTPFGGVQVRHTKSLINRSSQLDTQFMKGGRVAVSITVVNLVSPI